jgi:hypothetical protein
VTRLHFFSGLTGLVLVACGDDAAPPPPDGGTADATPGDTVAPSVRETTPANGDTDVARDALLEIRFSEPVARTSGQILVDPGGVNRLATDEGTWDDAGNAFTFDASRLWPSGDVTVAISGFADLAGNPMEPMIIAFQTVDDVPPSVVSTTPAEGASDLSARDTEIVIEFNERMRASAGTLDVLGGAATVGAPVWSADDTTVSFPVTDLEYEREYEASLRGFTDLAGNRLDGTPYLDDGAIDFATGPDDDAPRVVRSDPTEGQVDIDPARTTAVLVTFDEAMDTSITAVTLSDGETETPVDASWTGGGRTLRVEVGGLLRFDTSYAIDLRALMDRNGNALDAATVLVDGRLDFTVGLDAFLPIVRAASPAEGEADVSYLETTEVRVSFSEAMDTGVATAPLASGTEPPIDVAASWTSDTEVVFDVEGLLAAGVVISLDLRGMRDARGNLLDPEDPLTHDGRLDFTTAAPLGEGCRDPLTIASAMETSPGVYAWTVSSLQGSERDGGTAFCDISATGTNGTDVLVRFDKVSGTTSTGGRLLHIELDGSTSTATGTTPYDIAVMTGASCDPAAMPLECHPNAAFHSMDLDLPAGPVWIWLARTTLSTTAASVVLTVTETDPPPLEGDSCANPFSISSAIHSTPSTNVHRFAIPQNALRSVSIGPYGYRTPGDFSCDTAIGHGIDGVIRFDKPDESSVLRVGAVRTAGSDTLNVEVFDGCNAGSRESLGCVPNVSTTAQELIVDGPAGPVFVWVGDSATTVSRSSSMWNYSSGIDVTVTVVPDVEDGEICSRALAATSGSNAVRGTSDQRFQAPSCFGASSSVEWYRVTATHEVMLVSADASGALGFADADTGAELACVADGRALTLTRVLPVGESVCLAVEMGRGIGNVTVSGQTYTGLGRSAPIDLEILRPFNATASAEESVTGDAWMVVNDTHLLMEHISSAVLDVSREGHERAIRRGTDDGITSTPIGRTAVVVDGALFSFTTGTTATGSRVTRLWDGRSPLWVALPWDIGATYPTSAIQGAAEVGSDLIYVTSTTTSFYRLSSLAPSIPIALGTNAAISNVRGMTADETFLYVSATVGGLRGIYRVPIADVTATPTALAISDSFSTSTTQATAMDVDSRTAPRHLYVRNAAGEVEAIIDPASAAPFYLGTVIDRGTSSDWAMTIHHPSGHLYLFETETLSTGRWLRYEP